MIVGLPKEIKNHEYRAGLTPGAVHEVIGHGHEVLVEKSAGEGIGISDTDYQKAGAKIAKNAAEVFEKAELVVKVKEPQPQECKMLKKNQVLFTFLHLAPDPVQTELLQESQCTAIAYETVTDEKGALPLLAPMSEVAGRLSVQAGGWCIQKHAGGAGILISGVPGVAASKVAIIGGGVSGVNAARMAVGLGAEVTILERSMDRIRELDNMFEGRARIIYSTRATVNQYVTDADVVIGAVLIPGAAAPKLIDRAMLKKMRAGSAFVDIAIDQGGCAETSRVTSHDDPVFVEEGVIHYCVANMPGAVARTSTFALGNVTLPFVVDLANKGAQKALQEDIHLRNGLNVHDGHVTYEAAALSLGKEYVPAKKAMNLH